MQSLLTVVSSGGSDLSTSIKMEIAWLLLPISMLGSRLLNSSRASASDQPKAAN